MEYFIKAIQSTSIPNLLIVVGLFIVVLAFLTKIGGVIEVSPEQRRWAVPVGIFLLVLGLILDFSTVTPSTPPPTPGTFSTPTLSPSLISEQYYWDELHKVAESWDLTKAKKYLAELTKSKDKCIVEFAKRFENELNIKGAEGFKSINPIKCSINNQPSCKLKVTKFDFSPQCL